MFDGFLNKFLFDSCFKQLKKIKLTSVSWLRLELNKIRKKMKVGFRIVHQKQKLNESFELIALIAEIKLEKKENDAVIGYLNDLSIFLDDFLKLQESNPEKFKALLLKDDFQPNIIHIKDSGAIEFDSFSDDTNPPFDPLTIPAFIESSQGLYIGIQVFIKVYYRIWYKAVEINNSTIAYRTIENIVSVVQKLSASNKNYNIIRYFLDILLSMTMESAKRGNITSAYLTLSTYDWYLATVFSTRFMIEYIRDFNVHLFKSFKYVIDNKINEIFKSFVSTIIDRNLYPTLYYSNNDLFERISFASEVTSSPFESQLFEKDSKIRHVANTAKFPEDFNLLEREINDFKNYLETFSSDDLTNTELISKVIENLKNYVYSYYKFNNLQLTVLWIGTYCVFKDDFEDLEYLFNYNSPKDSAAVWVNEDINPLEIDEIISLIINKYLVERDIMFYWGGHHDFSGYFMQYILLLLVNCINHKLRRREQIKENSYDYLVENKTKDDINNFIIQFKLLKGIAVNLKEKDNFITSVNFSQDIIDNQLIPLLDNIINTCEQKLDSVEKYAHLDLNIITSFKSGFLNKFNTNAIYRNIFKHFTKQEIILKNFNKDVMAFGINEVSLKSFFAENDTGTYIEWPEGFALRMVFQENSFFKTAIGKKCKSNLRIKEGDIFEEINKIDLKDKIIIGTNIYFPTRVFGQTKDFKPNWELEKEDWHSQTGFQGVYKDCEVFNYYDQTNWKSFRILNKHHLGQIKQYRPFENIDSSEILDIFFFKIDSYSENKELMEEMLQKPPYWLQEIGNKKEQMDFLLKQVRIRIVERLELVFDEKFEGYAYYI